MKPTHILYASAAALLLMLPSCSVMYPPTAPAHNEPYIELKSGEKFSGGLLKGNLPEAGKNEIRLGDTTFRNRDVAFYSAGQKNYANVGRRLFAPQVAAGRINMYRYSTARFGHDTGYVHGPNLLFSLNNERYYIQNGDKGPLEILDYRNLRDMAAPNTPEYAILERYRKARNVIYLVTGGVFAAEIPLVLQSGPYNRSSSDNTTIGLLVLAFTALLVTDDILLYHNYNRLLRAVFASGASAGKQNQ